MNTIVVGVEGVFGWVAGVSAKAVILILIVFVLQKALRGRISARLGYCLWLIVIARMLLPYSVPSVASVFNLVPQVNNIYQPQRTGVFAPVGVSGRGTVADVPSPAVVDSVQNGVVSGRTAQSPDVSNNPDTRPVDDRAESTGRYGGLSERGLVLIVWLAGVIAMGGYVIVSQIRLWRVIRKQPSLVDQRIPALFEDVRRKMKVHIPVALVRADCVDSPVLFGFIRPRLLLPGKCVETFDNAQLGHIFSHELAHVRRNDIFVGRVAVCLQVLHWFNPLVWLAFARLRYYRELACGISVHKREGQPADLVPKFAISKNTFWKNREDTTNCQKSGDSFTMEVKFKDSNAGDFSVEDPALKGQGLTDPAVIKQLLIKLKAYDQ